MAHDKDTLAEDWVTLWQSELAAMAADRELRENWTGLLALWTSAAAATLQISAGWQAAARPPHDPNAGRTANGAANAAQPPGAAAAIAASDLGGDAAGRLHERIAELESRLSEFERRRQSAEPRTRKPARPGNS